MLFCPLIGFSGVTQADGDNSVFSQVRKNAEYTLEGSGTHFNQKPASSESNQSNVHLQLRQKIKSQANINDNWGLDFDLHLTLTSQHHDYAGAFRSPGSEERHGESLDFNTLFLTYTTDTYDMVIGKEIIETGIAQSNAPTNRFGLVNGINPMHPEKLGIWQIGLNYFIDDDTLSFKATPFHERSMTPQKRSRWLGTSGDADFQSITLPAGAPSLSNSTIEEKYYNESPEHWGYLLQYKGVREGYDFFGLIHHGPSIYPVLKRIGNTNNYEKIDPQAWSIGGGISKVSDEWTYYAEGIVQVTDSDKDEDFLRYTLGFSYRDTEYANSIGIQEIKPIVEYSGDSTISKQSANNYIVSSAEARPFQDTLNLRVEILWSDKWSYVIGGIFNLDEEDRSFGVGAQYKPNDNTKIRFGLTTFSGDDDTHFGRWKENDNIEAAFEYKF